MRSGAHKGLSVEMSLLLSFLSAVTAVVVFSKSWIQ